MLEDYVFPVISAILKQYFLFFTFAPNDQWWNSFTKLYISYWKVAVRNSNSASRLSQAPPALNTTIIIKSFKKFETNLLPRSTFHQLFRYSLHSTNRFSNSNEKNLSISIFRKLRLTHSKRGFPEAFASSKSILQSPLYWLRSSFCLTCSSDIEIRAAAAAYFLDECFTDVLS